MVRLFASFCITFFVFANAYAHSTGNSIETHVGEYLLDIGYDAKALVPGQPITFTYTAIHKPDAPDWEFLDMTELHVQITMDGSEPFEHTMKIDAYTVPNVTYTFPKVGTYNMHVRMTGEKGEVVETTIPVQIQQEQVNTASVVMMIGYGIVALLFLVFAVLFIRDIRAKKGA